MVGTDGRRTMATQRGASVGLSPDDLEEAWFRDAALLHVPAYSLFVEPIASATRAAIRVVREAGGMVAVDLSSAAGLRAFGPSRMAYVLARMKPEVLFATEAEAATLAVPLESLAQVPVLKLGAAGSIVFGRTVPAPEVRVVDPTGAGDAFAAAFCSSWRAGRRRRGGRARGPGGLAVGDAGGGAAVLSDVLVVSAEVAAALDDGRPVVALETSIVGQGLPAPFNLRAAHGCEDAIREEGAVPATVAVLDGRLRVGLSGADLERIAEGSVKVSSRDLGPVIARRAAGATTVAATMRAAAMAGIRFSPRAHRRHPPRATPKISRPTLKSWLAPAWPCSVPGQDHPRPALTLERLESLSSPSSATHRRVPGLLHAPQRVPGQRAGRRSRRVRTRPARVVGKRRPRAVVAVRRRPTSKEPSRVTLRAVAEISGRWSGRSHPPLLARVAELSRRLGRPLPTTRAGRVRTRRSVDPRADRAPAAARCRRPGTRRCRSRGRGRTGSPAAPA